MRIIIIISIFLAIFGLAGYYVYNRTAQAFTGTFINSKPFLVFYVVLLSSFFMGKILENFSINFFSNTLVWIGGIGAGFFIYALLFIIFFDFLRLINSIIPFYPNFITANYQKAKLIIGIVSFAAISVIFITGYINAKTPKVKKLNIAINKSGATFKNLNIVAISDIHLGTAVNKSKTKRLIKTINELNPDLVLIGGDIIDDNIEVAKYFGLMEYFKNLKPKYGVYSCLGNHEYISKAYKDLDYFEKNGIHMLKDSTIKIDDKFYIISRDDIEGERMSGGKERKSLDELTEGVDFNLPVFLLDHQPFKLEKTAEYDIDFQFSGHTHNGQFWPLNYITGLIFEEDWGYLKKKNTHFYISSGFGTAVVPIKVGNNSEIVNIRVNNKPR
ncbi:MAG: hypothetical protein B6I20_02835 [Bacteroidetes bacterium 4572_117]|nr:MAG: hypothetical protein B6I20_02835 [Bacteroidetes bacterium 4572_117]